MNNGESNNNNSNGIPNGTSNGNNHNNNNTGGSNAKPNNANKPRRSRAAAGRNVPALVEQTDLAQLLLPTFMADGGPLLEANNVRNGRKRPHSVLEQECVGVGSSSSSSSSAINNNNDSFTSSGHEMEFVLPICTRPMQALNSASVGIDSQFLAGTSSVGFHEFSSPMCTRPMAEMNSSNVGTGSQILAGSSSVGFHEFSSPMGTRPMAEMNSSSVGNGSQILAGTSSVGFHEFASPMGTRPMPEMNSSSVGTGSQILASSSAIGLQDVPEHIRDAVCRVNARQLSKMVDVHPAYAADVPSIGANGLSNLTWLLLDWAEGMVMQRVVGIVAAAGPFQTQGNLQGFDVRLVLNGPDGQELALHAWGELAGRLSGLRVNDVAEFFRLKVRGQCKFPKGSFPYVLLFNGESRCQLLSRASSSSAITAISVGEGVVAPMVVEPIEWSGAVAEPLQGGQRSAESPAADVVVAAHVGNAQNGQEEAEEDDDEENADSDQNGTATTGWLCANRPPPRASAVCAQQRLHFVVGQINLLEQQVARDERNARDRRQRRRRNTRIPLITIGESDEEEAPLLGLEGRQELLSADQRFYAGEMWPVEDLIQHGMAEGEPNVVQVLDNHQLPAADREWLCSTAFVMQCLPSSLKGVPETDEEGRQNLTCPICYDWLIGKGQHCVRLLCAHILHRECFDQEARHRRVCPLCSAHFLTGKTMGR